MKSGECEGMGNSILLEMRDPEKAITTVAVAACALAPFFLNQCILRDKSSF
jgi:hypothetical protein